MKTKEELNALKNEIEELNKKLAELTDEELAQVSGGKEDAFVNRHNIREPLTTFVADLSSLDAGQK